MCSIQQGKFLQKGIRKWGELGGIAQVLSSKAGGSWEQNSMRQGLWGAILIWL